MIARLRAIGIALGLIGIVCGITAGTASAATGGTVYPVGPGEVTLNTDPSMLVAAVELYGNGISVDWMSYRNERGIAMQGGGIAAWTNDMVAGLGVRSDGSPIVVFTPRSPQSQG